MPASPALEALGWLLQSTLRTPLGFASIIFKHFPISSSTEWRQPSLLDQGWWVERNIAVEARWWSSACKDLKEDEQEDSVRGSREHCSIGRGCPEKYPGGRGYRSLILCWITRLVRSKPEPWIKASHCGFFLVYVLIFVFNFKLNSLWSLMSFCPSPVRNQELTHAVRAIAHFAFTPLRCLPHLCNRK